MTALDACRRTAPGQQGFVSYVDLKITVAAADYPCLSSAPPVRLPIQIPRNHWNLPEKLSAPLVP